MILSLIGTAASFPTGSKILEPGVRPEPAVWKAMTCDIVLVESFFVDPYPLGSRKKPQWKGKFYYDPDTGRSVKRWTKIGNETTWQILIADGQNKLNAFRNEQQCKKTYDFRPIANPDFAKNLDFVKTHWIYRDGEYVKSYLWSKDLDNYQQPDRDFEYQIVEEADTRFPMQFIAPARLFTGSIKGKVVMVLQDFLNCKSGVPKEVEELYKLPDDCEVQASPKFAQDSFMMPVLE